MAVTIIDIAKKAGVNDSTVSRILTGNTKYRFAPGTVKKVRDAAKKMGYKPNALASSLKTGKTGCIGIATPGALAGQFNQPYANTIYLGISEYFKDKNYNIVFPSFTSRYDLTKTLTLAESRRVDGLIVLLTSELIPHFEESLLPPLQQLEIPFVCIHALAEEKGYPCVGLDGEQGGYLAGMHLLEHGYDMIGYVSRKDPPLHEKYTYQGYTRALAEAGRKPDPGHRYKSNGIYTGSGYELADDMLKRNTPLPRALFVCIDQVAAGMQMRLLEAGIRIPDDIALVGMGDYIQQEISLTALSTIDAKTRERGMEASAMLDRMLTGEAPKGKTIILEPELVKRKSCGC